MTNLGVVQNQHEFTCAICDAPVPAPTDLLDRINACRDGILCEDCENTDFVWVKPQLTYAPASTWATEVAQ